MTVLGPLYCWAPSQLREEITTKGLVIEDKPSLAQLRYKVAGVVCCAPTPEQALAALPLL